MWKKHECITLVLECKKGEMLDAINKWYLSYLHDIVKATSVEWFIIIIVITRSSSSLSSSSRTTLVRATSVEWIFPFLLIPPLPLCFSPRITLYLFMMIIIIFATITWQWFNHGNFQADKNNFCEYNNPEGAGHSEDEYSFGFKANGLWNFGTEINWWLHFQPSHTNVSVFFWKHNWVFSAACPYFKCFSADCKWEFFFK